MTANPMSALREALKPFLLSACAALLMVPSSVGPALAQGQDSTTSTQAPQTSGHPVPLLSTQDVVSVPSGNPIAGQPLAQEMRSRSPNAFGIAGPVAIPQVQLACDAIQDDTARSRCQTRSSPAAPPRGLPE